MPDKAKMPDVMMECAGDDAAIWGTLVDKPVRLQDIYQAMYSPLTWVIIIPH